MVNKVSKMQARVNASAEEREFMDALRKNPPPNTFWDDAQKCYEVSIQGLEQTHGQLVDHIQAMMADPVRKAKITDMPGLLANVNLLTKDIATHVAILNEVHALHAGKTGGTVAPEEHLEVIAINGRYADAIEMYNTVIMPTVTHIFEQIKLTEELIEDQKRVLEETLKQELEAKQAELIDPSVVSDIEVK